MEKTISWLKEHTVTIMSIFIVAVIAVFSLLYINNSLKNDLNDRDAKIVNLEKEITEKQTTIDNLDAEKEKMIGQIAQNAVAYDAEIADLKTKINALEDQKVNAFQYPDYYVDYLVQNGFANPKLLLATLSDNNNIIPIKGVLGGKMYWLPESSILLNDKFVFASFEDGHIAGFALLQYSFEAQGQVTWKVIETYME